uniref:Ctr_30_TN conopeptide n=4 Tax=Conoidea TaxID=37797 RepID=A0A0C9SFM1_CONTD
MVRRTSVGCCVLLVIVLLNLGSAVKDQKKQLICDQEETFCTVDPECCLLECCSGKCSSPCMPGKRALRQDLSRFIHHRSYVARRSAAFRRK